MKKPNVDDFVFAIIKKSIVSYKVVKVGTKYFYCAEKCFESKDFEHCWLQVPIKSLFYSSGNTLIQFYYSIEDTIKVAECDRIKSKLSEIFRYPKMAKFTYKQLSLVENILDDNYCEWTLKGDTYESQCGGAIAFNLCCNYTESKIKNNKYCMHCGKPIKPIKETYKNE